MNEKEIKRSQNVRLWGDLILIAPYLVWLSTKSKITDFDKVALISIGAATFFYNLYYYKKEMDVQV